MKIFFSLSIIFQAYFSNAQTLPEYCVYLVKGDVNIQNKNVQSRPARQKDFVFADDVITIGKNAQLQLVNKDAKYISLHSEGNYKVADLNKKLQTSPPGITKTYLTLVYHEVLDPNYDYSKFKRKNLGGIAGGVSRGSGCFEPVYPLKGMVSSRDSVQFKWYKSPAQSAYHFILYDNSGNEVLHRQLKDTSTIVAKKDLKFMDSNYHWLVKTSDSKCPEEPVWMQWVSKDDEQKRSAAIVWNFKELTVPFKLDAINKLVEDNMVDLAAQYYGQVVDENPDDALIKKSYVLFLLEYGFDADAEKIWNTIQNN